MVDSAPVVQFPLPDGVRQLPSGKVRERYELPDGRLLIVASDRISAFDYVLDTPIPDKGKALTALSVWWFEQLGDLVPHHLVTTEVPAGFPAEFAGRTMVCQRLDMVDVECVARGYLAGSGWAEYRRSRTVCGIELPAGLDNGSRLSEPIFTPTTKAPLGEHDLPVTFGEVEARVGPDRAAELRRITMDVYRRGHEIGLDRGLVIADTKIELGADPSGQLLLGDEVLTPDSSRFWPADQWRPGQSQPSFDKQYVRDWLTSPASGWSPDSGTAPPELPEHVVAETRAKYIEAYELLTGKTFTG